MALYVGETITLFQVATATVDGETVELTDADVNDVLITVYDSTGQIVSAEAPMVYSESNSRWEYVWDTSPSVAPGGTALEPGSYRVKVYILGLNNEENWEYQKVRLKANPV